MLKSKYKIYLLLLCLTGCVSEYNAQLPSSDEELLVVTGDIIANTEAIFSLSKSIPLSEDMPEDYRNIYARIAVVGSDGYRSDFGTALGDGKYQVSIGELQDDVSYGIEIEYDGEIYTSSPSTPMVSSEIDSVSGYSQNLNKHFLYGYRPMVIPEKLNTTCGTIGKTGR